jgi:hypothetical protein
MLISCLGKSMIKATRPTSPGALRSMRVSWFLTERGQTRRRAFGAGEIDRDAAFEAGGEQGDGSGEGGYEETEIFFMVAAQP